MGGYSSKLDPSVESVGGRSLVPTPMPIKRWLFWSIAECERLKGSPGSTPEIVAVFHMCCTSMIENAYINAFL